MVELVLEVIGVMVEVNVVNAMITQIRGSATVEIVVHGLI